MNQNCDSKNVLLQRGRILFLTILVTPFLHAYTIRPDHPRLIITSDDVKMIRNEYVVDGAMENPSINAWTALATPTVMEKKVFGTGQSLHLVSKVNEGAQQTLTFTPNVEYRYSVSVFLVSGGCQGDISQSAGTKNLFTVSSAGNWQTFTGTYVPSAGPLTLRFYGIGSVSSEYYIDNIKFQLNGNKIVDPNMEVPDCNAWTNMSPAPATKEKVTDLGAKALRLVAASGAGVYQYLNYKPDQEYSYEGKVKLISGKCRGQLYQGTKKLAVIFNESDNTQGWKTFAGHYMPSEGPLMIRFYGADASTSEFYVRDLSFKPSTERVVDNDMSALGTAAWTPMNSPLIEEKGVYQNQRGLRIVGLNNAGAYQFVDVTPGVTYNCQISVCLTTGKCTGQVYQNPTPEVPSPKPTVLFNLDPSKSVAPDSYNNWYTLNVPFTAITTPVLLRFYATDAKTGKKSEFYVNNISIKPTNQVSNDFAAPNFGELYNMVDRIENKGNPLYTPAAVADMVRSVDVTRSVAFIAMATQEKRFIDLAIKYADALSKHDANDKDDMSQRERLLGIMYVYDWLFDSLTDQQKNDFRVGMANHIVAFQQDVGPSGYPVQYLTSFNYVSGHGRGVCADALGALLTMYPDYPTGILYFDGPNWLSTLIDKFTNWYTPFQEWVAAEGGYHMGWAYGAGYTSCQPYLFWKSATGESWGESWRKNLASFYYYGVRGDDSLPSAGDTFSTLFNSDAVPTCILSATLGDPYAADFVNRYRIGTDSTTSIWRYIFMNENGFKANSTRFLEELPKAKSFGKTGYVIAKDKWDDVNSTQLIFKSASFYSLNHQHKDQNSILLNYKGPLLINSGCYDSYDSTHFQNYYTRTIACNSMVVYDPAETYTYASKTVSNDGGQNYIVSGSDTEPTNLAQAKSSPFVLGGVTSFSQDANSCTMTGDASSAYLKTKVSNYTRTVKMTYASPDNGNKPLINLYDHVALVGNKQNLSPAILFHSINPPVVDSGTRKIKIENAKGGGVEIEVVKPLDAVFKVVGGSKNEFSVNNVNYPIGSNTESSTQTIPADTDERGAWRVEVSSSTKGSMDFEFKLKVYDVQNSGFSQVQTGSK